MGARVSVALLALLSLCAGAARAEATAVAWTAPGECPDQAALLAELERLLGESVLRSARFTALAQVTSPAEHGFELELQFSTDQGSGTRHFQAGDCHQVLRFAAFSIALAIDPTLKPDAIDPTLNPDAMTPLPSTARESDAATPTPPTPPTPPPAQVAPAAPAAFANQTSSAPNPIPTTIDAPPPAPKARDGLWLGAQFVGDTALLPRTTGGLSLSGHKSWRHQTLRLGLGVEWFFPRSETLSTGEGGEFSLWLLELRGCYGRGDQLQLALCPTLASGQETGKGVDVHGARTQRSWFFAPGLAVLGVARPSDRWVVSVDAQALFPFPRDEFVVSDTPVHELPVVSFQIAMGLGVLAY